MTTRGTIVLLGSILLAPPTLAAQPEEVEPEPTPESCPCACEMHNQGPAICDVMDFLAFQSGFVQGDPCAINMDTSTGVGIGDIFDFLAFQQEFLSGVFTGC